LDGRFEAKRFQPAQGGKREGDQGDLSTPCLRVATLLTLSPQSMLSLSEAYNKSVQEESTLTPEQLKTRHVGKQDPKRHLEEAVEKAMGDQVVQNLGTMLLAEL
jgi:hypothetical protein